MSEYINIDCTGTFLKNAGIVGFIRFLKINNAKENDDYIIDGQEIRIKTDYLKNNDIAQMFFDTVTDILEKHTKFYKVITEDRDIIESLIQKGIENLDAKETKTLTEKLKNFETEMLKKSFKKVYDLINQDKISDIRVADAEIMKKEKDLNQKYQRYTSIIEKISTPVVERQFVYTAMLYDDFRYFFAENKTSHVISKLDDPKKRRRDIIQDNFCQYLTADMEAEEKKKKKTCIECMQKTAFPQSNTFLVDTADDIGKKKSYYWNLEPDAYICPVCALMYLFVPLGFVFLGKTAVFININTSIETMYKTMETYRSKASPDENENYYQRLYKLFTDQKIQMLLNTLSNIQVIFRDTASDHYNMKIINKDIVKKLSEANKSGQLSALEKVYLVHGSGKDTRYESVHNDVFDCIFAYKSMYSLIDKCLKYEFSKDSSRYWYIKNILKTEIIFNGGSNVNDLMKDVNWAFETGKSMRMAILGGNAYSGANEDDNSIRSYVYRLINLSSVGDTAQFMDTILRQYSGLGLTIPAVFKNCYKSEDEFKAIAHGYILGLKYCNSKGENDDE